MSTSAAAASGRTAPRSFCPLWSAPKLLFWKRLRSFQPCWPIVWNGGQTGSRAFRPPAAIARCVQKLRVALRDKLLLVTFRTKAEGGEQALSHPEYLAFLHLILDTDCADLLDIEFFTAGADLPALVEQAHSAGVAVVCSSHDFAKTPPRAELVSRMVQMQQAGADLPKLAVMPRCRTDVLELLTATAEMADLHPETPVITMSMGALGAVSRLAGETFGSAMTFANPGQASAPGQVPLDIVNEVLNALHL